MKEGKLAYSGGDANKKIRFSRAFSLCKYVLQLKKLEDCISFAMGF